MNQKKRSPGAPTPRLQESENICEFLRFNANSTPNQDDYKQYLLARYNAAKSVAEADSSRKNLSIWADRLGQLPLGLLTGDGS